MCIIVLIYNTKISIISILYIYSNHHRVSPGTLCLQPNVLSCFKQPFTLGLLPSHQDTYRVGLHHHQKPETLAPFSALENLLPSLAAFLYLISPIVLGLPKCQEERLCSSNSGFRHCKNIWGKGNTGLKTRYKFQREKPSQISKFSSSKKKIQSSTSTNSHVGYSNCYVSSIILNNTIKNLLYMCLYSWHGFQIAETQDIIQGALLKQIENEVLNFMVEGERRTFSSFNRVCFSKKIP